MKKIWIGIGIVVVVLVIVLLVAQTKKESDIVTQPKKEPEEIKIGAILPLTGGGGVYGQEIKKGIDFAMEEINKKGGINRQIVELIYEDDQGSPSSAISAFQKLVAHHKVQVVIGGAFSSCALAIAPMAEKEKVVLISPTASSPKLTLAGEFIFRNWPSDVLEGSQMAEFAAKSLKVKRVAILYSTSEYGIGLREVFKKRFKELGGEIVAEDAFKEDDTDFRTQLLKIKAKNPEGVYMTGYYKEFSQILKQGREIGLKTQFLSCVTFNEPELLKLAGKTAEGVFFTQPFYDTASEKQYVKNFVSSYKEKYGELPGIYAAHGYDALKIVALSIEKGGYSGSDIQKAMSSIKNFPGVSGETTFDENGDVIKPTRIFVVKEGKFIPVE